MGKKSGSAPDVAAASDVDRETARDQTYADRADQYNPFGSLTYSTRQVGNGIYDEDGVEGTTTKWTQNQKLTPQLQGAANNTFGMMNYQSAADNYNAKLARDKSGQVRDEMRGQANFDSFGDVVGFDPAQQRQAAEDAAYGRDTMRLDDRFSSQREGLEVKLRNQGLRPGDQAYDAQIKSLGLESNDAYERARYNSVGAGRDEFDMSLKGNDRANALRSQQIQEYIDKRGFSLGEQQALNQGQSTADISSMVTG